MLTGTYDRAQQSVHWHKSASGIRINSKCICWQRFIFFSKRWNKIVRSERRSRTQKIYVSCAPRRSFLLRKQKQCSVLPSGILYILSDWHLKPSLITNKQNQRSSFSHIKSIRIACIWRNGIKANAFITFVIINNNFSICFFFFHGIFAFTKHKESKAKIKRFHWF